MKKYNAIIVDDEIQTCEGINNLIAQYCPEIHVCGLAGSAEDGRILLKRFSVDFLFLDISMPNEDGFMFLQSLTPSNYGVIFVTAYQEYALRAIKASAIDYLLKPVNPYELQEAVAKSIRNYELRQSKTQEREVYYESLGNLQTHLNSRGAFITKLTVNELSGFQIVDVADIVYLEADDNYTILNLANKKQIVATRTLGEFEKIFEGTQFYRIHKSAIINMNYLAGFSNLEGSFAELKNGKRIEISRRKVLEFRERVKHFSISID